jgi:hypothetical protein
MATSHHDRKTDEAVRRPDGAGRHSTCRSRRGAVFPARSFRLRQDALLRAIAGLNEPEAGRILVGERDVTRVPPHRRDMGMVFQSYALWPHMTLRETSPSAWKCAR